MERPSDENKSLERMSVNRVFPIPYQVDFSLETKGKYINDTKRKLTWKFGFAHSPTVFPHKYDNDGNYLGDEEGATVDVADEDYKRGVECRGREHEIILVWSLLTGKAHLYVDSKEIYRHAALDSWIFDAFSATFHKGFDLPNPKHNGKHRINIRCYARTPIGAKNMSVDDKGGVFRQYELTVDGLSYFSMPAVYELGTQRMWKKISRWQIGDNSGPSGTPTGQRNDHFLLENDSEKKAMSPRSESEEQRMIRLATEASLRDWDNEHGYGKNSSPERSSLSRAKSSSGKKKKSKKSSKKNSSNLPQIGENSSNLIDFGAPTRDQLTRDFSSIEISNEPTSDVSVLGFDDDRTTASFMQKTHFPAGQPPAFAMPPQNIQHAGYGSPPPPQQQPQYRADPTYTPPHYHQPIQQQQPQVWNAAGSNPAQPQHSASSTASFAMAPPPTLDDFKNAFGSSMSVMPTASLMSPSSSGASVVTSSMSPQYNGMQYQQQQQQQHTTNYAQQPFQGAQTQNYAPPANKFDPLKLDPFAS